MPTQTMAGHSQSIIALVFKRVSSAIEAKRLRNTRKSGTAVHDQGRIGEVTLVGAGPGDVELLTLRAFRAIQTADVILYDALISDEILALVSPRTELIAVGKRGGRPSCRQDDINRLMADHAKSGQSVVRLKSGDPSIFGRSGEEVSYLRSCGVSVSVIPGITAASAMAATLGVTLTHRAHAKSVRFVTGHSKHGGIPDDVDWDAIADPSATTVFYMGAKTARAIVEKLLQRGVEANTPCVAAASVGRHDAQYRACTLRTLVAAIEDLPAEAPIVFGTGQVFAEVQSQERVLANA